MIFALFVLAFIVGEFCHRFWFYFGTPLPSKLILFCDRLLYNLLDIICMDFDPKTLLKAGDADPLFPHFFNPVPQRVFLKIP